MFGLLIVAGVTVITAVIVFTRAEAFAVLAGPSFRDQGRVIVREQLTGGFTIASLAFGLMVMLMFGIAEYQWGDSTLFLFALLGMGAAIFLSYIVRNVYKHEGINGASVVITINLLWGLGYGLLLPAVMLM